MKLHNLQELQLIGESIQDNNEKRKHFNENRIEILSNDFRDIWGNGDLSKKKKIF